MSLPASTGPKRLRILIVDDSSDFRALIVAFLKHEQYDLIEAEDGTVALDLLKDQSFDVCLLDMKMPLMDGLSTTVLYRSWEQQHEGKHLTIFALSAFTEKKCRDAFLTAGCDRFIEKPIRRLQLIDALRDVILKCG